MLLKMVTPPGSRVMHLTHRVLQFSGTCSVTTSARLRRSSIDAAGSAFPSDLNHCNAPIGQSVSEPKRSSQCVTWCTSHGVSTVGGQFRGTRWWRKGAARCAYSVFFAS